MKATNIKDNEYGLLTVIERDLSKTKMVYWFCQCQCGTIKSVAAKHLKRGDTQSCGCQHRKRGKSNPNYTGVGDLSGHHIAMMKQNAVKRSIEWNVTPQYLWDLYESQNRKCVLSGIDICLSDSKFAEQSASLDRKDSSIGYIEGNVQWVHKTVNQMKWDLAQDRFIELCRKVCENNVNT